MQKFCCIVLTVVVLAALVVHIEAYPSWSRQKRVSDQRLAELETLLALARLKGRMSGGRSSYGFLRIDPAKIGRKKRFVGEDDVVNTANEASEASEEVEMDRFLDNSSQRQHRAWLQGLVHLFPSDGSVDGENVADDETMRGSNSHQRRH